MAETGKPDDKPPGRPRELSPREDRREAFARITAGNPVDAATRRAFLEARMAMIRADARLSPEEKEEAVAALARQLDAE
ncbi:hypothetical protein DesfrDRAFT_1488 [Solidesulfovibrio fructosivorans JJ]]|uniref:Uncharacterized protein n=1 Tax=Solidesulfovibrio fructosivorans JJ] TaxID=596151 RepID=E1JV39_SOLFR|nr:hypothetical protein [Solidesulfovibrio fructosivorans]EFL51633.1 hypothetical protein DesfrDRAFT_1488 [Solidesulfovibrio fructosivorans JJ]]